MAAESEKSIEEKRRDGCQLEETPDRPTLIRKRWLSPLLYGTGMTSVFRF